MEQRKIVNGNGFEQMLMAQNESLKYFKVIQGLPEHDKGINDRQIQETIKKFTYCFLEELSEAYADAESAYEEISKNNLKEAQDKIINFNMEIADVTHFLLDILIYSDLSVDLGFVILERLLEEKNLDSLIDQENLLGTFFNIGHYLNTTIILPRDFTRFRIFSKSEYIEVNKSANQKLSVDDLSLQAKFCWEISKLILRAMNELKNREWHQSEKMVNNIKYYDLLLEFMIVLFQYFDVIGLTELTLFQNYFYKNEIVMQRIQNKY